jgi:hypothetical protein
MKILFLTPLLITSASAQAQGPFQLPQKGDPHRTILLGPELMVNRLQSGQAQARFGNPQGQVNGIFPSWRLLRPSVRSETPSNRIQFDQDIDFEFRSREKSSLWTVPVDFFAMQTLSVGRNRLFWKVGGSVTLTQLHSEPDGIKRGWRLATGGLVSGGITLGNTLSIEAGYRPLSRVRGFNLSSSFISASLRFPVGRTR